ncbi:TPA: helix-turn-helix domain-containing protein [Clostridioides difficile]
MGAKKLKKKYIPIKLATEKCTTGASVEDEDFFKYLTSLHTSNEGYISVLKKFNKKDIGRWSVPVNDAKLLACFKNEKDFYCSVNTHFAPASHSANSLKRLNAFIIDLDYYKEEHLKGLTATQVVNLLELELDYPTPSLYISSGQGVYILWLLNDTYATRKSKKFWSRIEAELINCFKDFGVDERVKDSARVLRLLGSVNSNTNEVVKIIGDNDSLSNPLRYEMMDFADYFWGTKELKPTPKAKPKKKQTTNKKVVQLKNILTLNHSRYRDIEKLVELRAGVDQTGIRELLLFIYRLHLLYANVDTEEALKRTIALNNKFLVPTDGADIARTDYANKAAETFHRLKQKYDDENREGSLSDYLGNSGAYIYKNSTLIKQLKITEEEQKYLSTIIGSKEKKRRKDIRNKEWYEDNKEYYQNYNKKSYKEKLKANGKLTRDEQNALRRAEIKALMDKGISQRNIAKELNISLSTVTKYVKNIKKGEH